MFAPLLFLIFIRPFICALAYPRQDLAYSLFLTGLLAFSLKEIRAAVKIISGIKIPLLLLLLSLGLSLAPSGDKLKSLITIYPHFLGAILFLWAVGLEEGRRRQVIKCVLWPAIAVSCLAIYQYFIGFQRLAGYVSEHHISDAFILDYIERRRAFFPFVTPNTLAGYLAMTGMLALTGKGRRWLIILPALALLLTKSIGGVLSFSAGATVYFLSQKKPGKKEKLAAAGAISAIIAILLWREFSGTGGHTQPGFSLLMRLDYWRQTLELISTHPILGVGAGNFNLTYSRYAHNSYLQLWAELGILGIASFLWLISAVLGPALKKVFAGYPVEKETAALLAACAAFLFHNNIDFTLFLPEVSFIWWVAFGLLFSSCRKSV